MTLTVTQADVARPPVAVALTGLPIVESDATGTVTGLVQRSSNGGVTWDFVRGMSDMVIDGSGNVATTNDYEFEPGADNDYRGGVMQEIVATFNATATNSWPAADTAQTWALTGTAANFDAAGGFGTIAATSATTTYLAAMAGTWGDAEVHWTNAYSTATITGTGTGVNVGAWLHYVDASNSYVVLTTVAPSGAQSLVILSIVGGVQTTLASTALPTYTGANRRFRVRINGNRIRVRSWLSAAAQPSTWDLDVVVGAAQRIAAGGTALYTFRNTGNTNSAWVASFRDLVVDTGSPALLSGQTDDITPGLAGVWLCSTLRSFLNCAPLIIGYDEPDRGGRGGETYVAGRTLPIAQAEVMTSRSWNVTFRATSLASARRLEYLFASGDIMFVQTPAGCPIPRGYYRVDRMAGKRVTPRSDKRLFEIPLRECARPGPDIVTAQNTWDSVWMTYGTWEQVAALGLTWEQLRDTLIGDPSEVIVE